ncbi:uncharacterized protein PHACADRAFT_200012 [Phanerochaete carnosa HHB-10118-sp]|uniref:F-box domain-containing protein n=1 Tax=Phanerochaete carnosa (strain HHB-10118-sp) TaxID=650164 RepID=K5UN75_PHACS|nr:uncharacterized protein PHACADRAFT_200012 [Phanerochaete carnosa HHB-10118-sp]EKM51186.1 hypothetical protein PHACADRAFT_200012 [Phanerochaete carnosa HHB-10118-sp]
MHMRSPTTATRSRRELEGAPGELEYEENAMPAMARIATMNSVQIVGDVVIVSHLTLRDLLHLTWASRHFREMLMSKSRKHLWAAARRNDPELPDPPPSISEPRLAAVLFSSYCFGCGNRGQKYDYGLVVRYCGSCWKFNLKRGFTIERQYRLAWDDPVFQLLPCSRNSLDYINAQMSNKDLDSYDVAEFQSVLGQYNSLRDFGDEKALQKFVDERKQYVRVMHEFAKSLQEWQINQKAAMRSVEDSRAESIKQKLLELGYTASDFPEGGWGIENYTYSQWLHILRQPRELTPRIWNNIRPRLEKILADQKLLREEQARRNRRVLRKLELRDVYEMFLPEAPVDDGPFPTASDAILIPEICSLLEEDEARIEMTEERLLTVLPALQEQARKFKVELVEAAWTHYARLSEPERGVTCYCEPLDVFDFDLTPPRHDPALDVKKLKCIPKDMEYRSEDVLDLATALFRCYFCVDIGDEPLPDTAVYSITELAKHVHTKHNRENRRPIKLPVDSRVARKVLSKLGLPEDIRYSEISGKIVCECATLSHPATFAQMVSHIMWETSFYHAASDCRSASECPKNEVLVHDHDLDKGPSFIRLLGDGESFEQPPLSPDEQELVETWSDTFNGRNIICNVCGMCTTIPESSDFWRQHADMDDFPYVPQAPCMEPDELVRHVKTKHARNAKVDDAREAPPELPW